MAESKFEKDLERLEKVVEALEEGGLTLDESLKRFEEGVRLARRCEKALTEAERRIEILVKDAKGEVATEPFAEQGEEAAQEGEEAAQKGEEAAQETAVSKAEVPEEGEEEEEEEGNLLF